MVYHKHLILRAEVEKPLVDPEETKEWLLNLVKDINMNITPNGGPHTYYVDKPGNQGVTGVVMIETSHISVHCWDREDPPVVQLDVYSCRKFDPAIPVSYIEKMEPRFFDYVFIDRSRYVEVIENKTMRKIH